MGTRVKVGAVGQGGNYELIRVNLDADDSAIRAELVTKAAAKLGVSMPSDVSAVNVFLAGGSPLTSMKDDEGASMIEKDDTIFFAFDGGAWQEPGDSTAPSPTPAAGGRWRSSRICSS